MKQKASGITFVVMLLLICVSFLPDAACAQEDLALEAMPQDYVVYLEGQTRVALGSAGMTEASCRALQLRKAPVWTLERVSGDSLTVRTEATSRMLDDGTVIYGCDLILYSLSKTGDTVYDLTCAAGKRAVTQRFTVHAVHCGDSVPESITFSNTVFQAAVHERVVIEPDILCAPSTAALPEEAVTHCVLDSQGIAALNQSVFAVTRRRTVLSFNTPGTYQAIFTYALSNIKYAVPVTIRILDSNGSIVVQASALALNHSNLWLTRNEMQTLNPVFTPANASNQAVSWTSSNPDVAAVSDSGLVTAKNCGTAIITCAPDDNRCPSASCFVTVEEWMTVEGFEETHELYLQGEQRNALFRLRLSDGTARRFRDEEIQVDWRLIPQENAGVLAHLSIAPDRYSAAVETDALRRAGVFTFEVRCETDLAEWSQTFTVQVHDLGESAPESVAIATPKVRLSVGQTVTVDFTPVCSPKTARFPEKLKDGLMAYTGYGGFYTAVDRSVYKAHGDQVTVAFKEEGSYLLVRTWKISNLSYSVSCCFAVDDDQQPALLTASETEAIVYLGGASAAVATYRIDSGLYQLLNGQVTWGLERVSGGSTEAALDVNGDHASLLVLKAGQVGQDVWRVRCTLQGVTVTEQITVNALAPRQSLPESIFLETTQIRAVSGQKAVAPLKVACVPASSALPDLGDDFWHFEMTAGQEDALTEAGIENDCLQLIFCESGYYTGTLTYRSGNVAFEILLCFTVSDEDNAVAAPQDIFLFMVNGTDTVYPEGETGLPIATVGLSESENRYVPGGLAAYAKEKNARWKITRTAGDSIALSIRDRGDGKAELILDAVSGNQAASWLIECLLDGRRISTAFSLKVAQPGEERPQPRLKENVYTVYVSQGVLMSNKVVSASGVLLQSLASWDASAALETIHHQYQSYDYGWYAKFYLPGTYQTAVNVLIGNLRFSLPMTIRVLADGQSAVVSVLPAGLTAIEEEAFAGSVIAVLDASNTSLRSIGPKAFSGCTQLRDIYLPDSVRQIDSTAFAGCGTVVIHCNENSFADRWAAGKAQFLVSHDFSY